MLCLRIKRPTRLLNSCVPCPTHIHPGEPCSTTHKGVLHTFYQPFPAPKSTSLASLRTPRNTATRVTIYWQQPLSSFDPMPQVLSQRPALVKDSQPVDTTLSSTQSSPPRSSKCRQSPFAAHSPNCFDTPTKQRPQSVLSTQHATCNAISFNATH